MIRPLFFATVLLLTSASANCQEKGIIRFAVEVDNGYFEILVNDTLLIKSYKDTLPYGEYQAVVWSPTYEPRSISFIVNAPDNETVHIKMKRKQSYLSSIQSENTLQTKRKVMLHLPVTLSVCSFVGAGVSWVFLNKNRKILQEELPKYGTIQSVIDLREYKENFAKAERNYNTSRAIFYSGIAIGAASTIFSIWSSRYLKKNFKRTQYKDHSPWHDRFSWRIGFSSMSLNFNL